MANLRSKQYAATVITTSTTTKKIIKSIVGNNIISPIL